MNISKNYLSLNKRVTNTSKIQKLIFRFPNLTKSSPLSLQLEKLPQLLRNSFYSPRYTRSFLELSSNMLRCVSWLNSFLNYVQRGSTASSYTTFAPNGWPGSQNKTNEEENPSVSCWCIVWSLWIILGCGSNTLSLSALQVSLIVSLMSRIYVNLGTRGQRLSLSSDPPREEHLYLALWINIQHSNTRTHTLAVFNRVFRLYFW